MPGPVQLSVGRHACNSLSPYDSAHQNVTSGGLEAPNAPSQALESSSLSAAEYGQGNWHWSLCTGEPALSSVYPMGRQASVWCDNGCQTIRVQICCPYPPTSGQVCDKLKWLEKITLMRCNVQQRSATLSLSDNEHAAEHSTAASFNLHVQLHCKDLMMITIPNNYCCKQPCLCMVQLCLQQHQAKAECIHPYLKCCWGAQSYEMSLM